MPDNDHDAAPTEDPSSGDPTTTDSEIDAAARWDELAGRYHFERCCSAALAIVRQAWERHTRGADDADDTLGDPSAEEVATALDHGSVAPILVDFVLDDADAGSPALGAFADALIERTTTPHTGAHLVRALNAEADGRVLEAEADFEASLAADPDYVPVIYELARFASDRGDIDRAVALYRRVGSGAQPEVDFLSGLLPDWSKVGRNDPCPCGSGRKFKQCHLDRPEVPAERAALWLFQKLLGFTYRHQFAAIRSDLARAALTGAMSNDEVVLVDDRALHANAVYQRFLDEPFLLDLAVFDCGIVERFAAERAVLLPPAETEMLHDWMAAERRLWEITGVEPDHHIVLRDVVSDATVEVAEQVASRSVETGDLLLALVVPVRGEMQLIGQPVSVKPPQRQTARDQVEQHVDALAWATWFGQLHARATSQNLDDEDLIAGAAVVRPSARIDVGALLDEHYQPGDTAGRWTDGLDVDGRRIVRAHLDLEDDGRIIVTANSDVRMDRVLDRLRAADPGLVIEGDERRPFDEQQLAALLARTPD